MKALSYVNALSVSDAVRALASSDAVPLGGGTDLLASISDGLESPTAVVDLRRASGVRGIAKTPDGTIRIGAATRIHGIASDPLVRDSLAALAEACAAVGSPALRHMGTLGGNLCQRPRCWYLRRGISCHKNGGSSCPAKDGENQHHAILEGGPCHMVHPSDPAVALLALDASVEVEGARGQRRVPMADFIVLPSARMDAEVSLEPGEFVTAVVIPAASVGGKQRYRKQTQRTTFDFALASIAGVRRADGTVRLAMGGVAPRPWRVPLSVEEDVMSGNLDEDSINALAERALYDAKPLSKNAYKVDLAASLLKDAMRFLTT